MKKEILLIVSLLFLGTSCKQYVSLTKLSNEIYENQTSKFNNNMFLKGLHYYRESLDLMNKIKFSTFNDTIFALETLGVEGDLHLTYWNKMDTISYTNVTGKIEYLNGTLYSKHMMKLVSAWNIPEIEKEEKINSNLLPNTTVYATRIIFYDNKRKIDCIHFNDFFNLQRDQ